MLPDSKPSLLCSPHLNKKAKAGKMKLNGMKTTNQRLACLRDKVLAHAFWDGSLFSLFETAVSDKRLSTIVFREYVYGASIYGRHFQEYLQYLIDGLDDRPIRKALIQNLNEEKGSSSDGKIKVGAAHTVLFSELQSQVDRLEPIEPLSPHPLVGQIQFLIRQKMHAQEVMIGVGSIIFASELIVPRLYSKVVEFVTCSGLPEKLTDFFKLHIECDQDHCDLALRALSESNLSAAEYDMLEFGAISSMNLRAAMFDAIAMNITRNFPDE